MNIVAFHPFARHRFFYILGLCVLLFTFCSCHSGNDGKDGVSQSGAKQASTGLPCEVLLAADTEVLGSRAIDSLEDVLKCDVPGLNQGEKFFRVSRINLALDKYETKRMHTRLLVKIKKDVKDVTLGSATDLTATPQLQLQLTVPSTDALCAYLAEHADYLRQLLLENQLRNQSVFLAKYRSDKVAKELKTLFGYTIDAPEEVRFTKTGKDFLWGSSRSNEKQLNMVFYTRPYYGENITDARALAVLRDSVMMENIPGSQPDQWMETVWENDQPVVLVTPRKLDVLSNGKKVGTAPRLVTEMRGLWQMRNGAMGGPFVSISFVDSVAHRLVVAEGFVFSPSTSKRDLIRKLEASLRTLR